MDKEPLNTTSREEETSTVTGSTATSGTGNFDRLKYFVDLGKWLITSVALVLITQSIEAGFRDRSQGMQEIAQYDKYVTDLIVLNEKPGARRNLAQFFAFVTPSGRLREGWKDYFAAIDQEYRAATEATRALDRQKQKELAALLLEPRPDSARLEEINRALSQTQAILNPEIVVPGSTDTKPWAAAEERGFRALLARNINDAIGAFSESERLKPGYHMVYEIGNYLKQHKSELDDATSESWPEAYRWIQQHAAWGMPVTFRNAVTPAYRAE